jgi:hypothetical protein
VLVGTTNPGHVPGIRGREEPVLVDIVAVSEAQSPPVEGVTMAREAVRWTADMARAIRDPWSQPPVETGPHPARPGRGHRPLAVTAAGWAFVARAVLRLPLPIFAAFYILNDIEFVPLRRSSDAPDGAQFIWLAYAGADLDNAVLYPLALLLGGARHANVIWLVAYAAATAGYLTVGLAFWRRRAIGPRLRRVAVLLLGLDLSWRLLWLLLLLPGAIGALHSGENQVPLPRAQPPIFGERYSGEHLVHFYEWMFVPWAVTLAAVVVAVALLLRTEPARRYLGIEGGWWRRAR